MALLGRDIWSRKPEDLHFTAIVDIKGGRSLQNWGLEWPHGACVQMRHASKERFPWLAGEPSCIQIKLQPNGRSNNSSSENLLSLRDIFRLQETAWLRYRPVDVRYIPCNAWCLQENSDVFRPFTQRVRHTSSVYHRHAAPDTFTLKNKNTESTYAARCHGWTRHHG